MKLSTIKKQILQAAQEQDLNLDFEIVEGVNIYDYFKTLADDLSEQEAKAYAKEMTDLVAFDKPYLVQYAGETTFWNNLYLDNKYSKQVLKESILANALDFDLSKIDKINDWNL